MKNMFLALLLISANIIGQSLKQNYIIEQKTNGGAKEIGEYNFVEYSIKSNEGKLLYQIIDKVDYDIPFSKLEIFENGSSVLINAFYGTLTFISNSGTKVKSVKIKENYKVEYERSIQSVVNRKSLLILFQEQNANTSTIQKYSEGGTIEAEFEIPISNVNGIAFSKKLDQIFISHIGWGKSGGIDRIVTLLNSDGEEIKKYNANFEKGFFTDDNLFIGMLNKSVFSINTSTLELNFEIKAEENSMFIDVTEENNLVFVAQANKPELVSGVWYYKNPIVKIIDINGNIIKRKSYKSEAFSNYKFNISQNSVEFHFGEEKVVIE